MILTAIVLGTGGGCAAVPHSAPKQALQKAKTLASQGEYYKARKTAEEILKKNSNDLEAKALIAQIIDQELTAHKELFKDRVPEELNGDEQSIELQAWLERSRSLLEIGEYDEALIAAEKVFSFDPEHKEASQLVDLIRQTALKDGQAEMLIKNKMARDESGQRVADYLVTARHALEIKRYGEARLTLNKILLLDPENEEALKMRSELETKTKAA